jgi:hypothetical protein
VQHFFRQCRRALAVPFVMLTLTAGSLYAAPAPADVAPKVALSGHLLPALAKARVVTAGVKVGQAAATPMTLTVTLNRSDAAGFDRYVTGLYQPGSATYRQFAKPTEVSDRFGPSQDDFDAVKSYFEQQGLKVADVASNRMTMTLEGTRATVNKALGVTIADYTLNKRTFFANTSAPMLPASIAAKVQSIAGLSDLARPTRSPATVANGEAIHKAIVAVLKQLCASWNEYVDKASGTTAAANAPGSGRWDCNTIKRAAAKDAPLQNWQDADGSGQKIGLVEYDTFVLSDVVNFLALTLQPAALVNNVSQVHVNGGASAGANQAEVLIDIDVLLTGASGANVAVYDAPFTGAGSFQSIFNRMITDGMTVISNSWSYCEDQTTLADVQSIDSILTTAAASGISVFNATGDSGSTCLDGAANTAGVPATSPHATAVGGASLITGPGGIYQSATWWNGTADVPPTGQGGFGTSRYFSRPAYQNGVTISSARSIPDVVTNADPAQGIFICQASNGGCPNGFLNGGTSMAAPVWAGYAALLNQAQGSNFGFFNPLLYPLVNTAAFHTPASMGSDVAHVGLGFPNVDAIHVALAGLTLGPAVTATSSMQFLTPDPNVAAVSTSTGTPADATTPMTVIVFLRDAHGNMLSGKTVTLAANAGSHATITPASVVTTAANGAAVFTVTDGTVENLTFSATDSTDGIVITAITPASFVVPPATSASIAANPTSVPPDGVSATTITVTLHDASNNPTPGKVVSLSQGAGHSVLAAPSPAVTNASGQIQFTATDGVSETVVYTAVDVTDGNLPVPGSATVNFTGAATSCVGAPPVAASGFTVTPFSTGYFAQNFNFGNVNWGGCPGASNPTFNTSGSVYVANFRTGDLFKFGIGGGAVSSGNTLSNLNQTLGQPTFGKDGRLYATHGATTGDFTTGNIVEVDPTTGAQLRVVASNLTCPNALTVDPLSGDLFFDDQCFGGGSNNPSLWRIHDPAGAATLSVYATLPSSPNGAVSISPDGTIYVVVGYTDPTPVVLKVSGTNTPSPPTMTPVPNLTSNYWVTVGAAQSNGAAKSLIVLATAGLTLVDITTTPYTTTLLTAGQSVGSGVIGPDGCLYAAESDTIYKLTTSSGSCGFVPTNPSPALTLTPATVSPNPAQGTSQTFTATFSNTSVPAGTPVYFAINGANPQLKLGTTNANGVASISYVGDHAGGDTVTATATVGTSPFTSNSANLTWAAGKHSSFASLNLSPSGGTIGAPVTLVASLSDVSVTPNAIISGATIQFTLGAQTCSGVTNGHGLASCSVTAPSTQSTLTANFAGNAQFTASTASQGFGVVGAAVGPTVPGAPTIGAATGGNGFLVVSFAPPASDGGSAITQYTATCTPLTAGASASGTGATSPITVFGVTNGVTYTCVVSAANTVGTGASSTASNAATPAGTGPVVLAPIPTLDRTGEIMLVVLLALLAVFRLRRRT